MKQRMILRNNALSLVMFGAFLVFWAGQAVTGWRHENHERARHDQAPATLGQYLMSGEFVEATAENWESEFFQMAAFVFLSAFLVQRGSAESKKPEGPEEHPERKRSHRNVPGPVRRGGVLLHLYNHSLGLAFTGLFLVSFAAHAWGGLRAANEAAQAHGRPPQTLGQFLGSATFWFQSLQNWQSEFLSVGAIVVLSIFLRQKGSPESKPVAAPHWQTGT
jgi:hypothetical protein